MVIPPMRGINHINAYITEIVTVDRSKKRLQQGNEDGF